jgi:hypothetical protein
MLRFCSTIFFPTNPTIILTTSADDPCFELEAFFYQARTHPYPASPIEIGFQLTCSKVITLGFGHM